MGAPAPHQEPSKGFSTGRPSTGQTENVSIKSEDSENTVIHKTVLKWYDRARLPALYHRTSFGSFFDREGMLNETPPLYPGKSDRDMDENAVGWEDVYDPENPMDWSKWKKGLNFLVIFMISFTSYVCFFDSIQHTIY